MNRADIIRKTQNLLSIVNSGVRGKEETRLFREKANELIKKYKLTAVEISYTAVPVVKPIVHPVYTPPHVTPTPAPTAAHVHTYSCKKCKKIFKSEDELKKHHHPKVRTNIVFSKVEPKFVCVVCNKEFKSKLALAGHMRTHPTTEKRKIVETYHCEVCKKVFDNDKSLIAHRVSAHTFKKDVFKCKMTFATFQEVYYYFNKFKHKMSPQHKAGFVAYLLNIDVKNLPTVHKIRKIDK